MWNITSGSTSSHLTIMLYEEVQKHLVWNRAATWSSMCCWRPTNWSASTQRVSDQWTGLSWLWMKLIGWRITSPKWDLLETFFCCLPCKFFQNFLFFFFFLIVPFNLATFLFRNILLCLSLTLLCKLSCTLAVGIEFIFSNVSSSLKIWSSLFDIS